MPSRTSIPSPSVREQVSSSLNDLVHAIESHPSWPNGGPASGAAPPKSLYHVWDFVNRSRYIMTELDNIRDGLPLKHPEQIPGAMKDSAGSTGEAAAARAFTDVCTRGITIDQMVQNPRMLTMLGLSQVDFGSEIQQKSQALIDAIGLADS